LRNPAEDRAVTNLQTEALLHLAAADPGLPVPRIFPARNGMTELDVTFDDGSTRVVRLLSYLAGTPMHAAAGSTALRRDLGRCAARLTQGSWRFQPLRRQSQIAVGPSARRRTAAADDAVPVERRGLVEDVLGGFEDQRPAGTSAVAEPARP
jgi:Ser/Thr protein kinase RdoA (MazF antagonist)